jgi:hypothetical protein
VLPYCFVPLAFVAVLVAAVVPRRFLPAAAGLLSAVWLPITGGMVYVWKAIASSGDGAPARVNGPALFALWLAGGLALVWLPVAARRLLDGPRHNAVPREGSPRPRGFPVVRRDDEIPPAPAD